MLHRALALVLLAAASAEAVCNAQNGCTVCLDLGDDWLGTALEQCFNGETPTVLEGAAVSSKISLELAASGSVAAGGASAAASANASAVVDLQKVYSVVPKLVSLTCSNAQAVFQVQKSVQANLGALANFTAAATLNAALALSRVDGKVVLGWSGSVLSGTAKDLKTRFAVAKATVAAKVASWVGLVVNGLHAPALPSLVRFTGNPLLLLSHAASCPLTLLAPSASDYVGALLNVPSAGKAVPVVSAEFDPCLLRTLLHCESCETEVVAKFNAAVDVALFKGSTMKDMDIRVVATAGGDQPGLSWTGSATGSLAVLDNLYASARGDFSSAGLVNVVAELDFTTEAVHVSGELSWENDCATTGVTTGRNGGSVLVELLDSSAYGELTQVSCNAWSLFADLAVSEPTHHGIALAYASASLDVVKGSHGVSVSGVVEGTASVGSLAEGAAKLVIADGKVTSFSVDGTFDAGVVVGSLELDVQDHSLVSGSGELHVVLDNGEVPLFSAMLDVAKEFGEGDVVWTVKGAMPTVTVHGADVLDAAIDLEAVWSNGALVWSGSLTGRVNLPFLNTVADASVAISHNKFGSLTASLVYDSQGVAISSQIALDATGGHASCPTGLRLSGASHLSFSSFSFDGTLTACSEPVAADLPVVSFSGEMTKAAPFGHVGLSHGSVVVAAHKSEPGVLVWSGTVAANTELFGGTSSGTLAFSSGQFGMLAVDAAFTTPSQVINGVLSLSYNGSCDVASGNADLWVGVEGAEPLFVSGSLTYNVYTGELLLAAQTTVEWNGPWDALVKDVQVTLFAEGNNGEIGLGLAKRRWYGSVDGLLRVAGAEAAVSVAIDTAKALASVTGSLTYDGEHIYVGAALQAGIDERCSGNGTVILRNLPFGLPNAETSVVVEMAQCGHPELGWSVHGVLPTVYVLPFHTKTFSLNATKIAVQHFASGEVAVSLGGAMHGMLDLSVSFNSSAILDTLRVAGGVALGQDLTLSDFIAVCGGELDVPEGGHPELIASLKSLAVDASASVELLFDEKRVQLEGHGRFLGVGVDVVAVAEASANAGKGWVFGLATSAFRTGELGHLALDGTAGVLATAVDHLLPQELSVALGSLELSGHALEVVLGSGKQVTIPAGLTCGMVLDAANAALKDLADRTDAAIAAQIEAIKDAAGAVRVLAHVAGSASIDLQAQLAGNLTIGDHFGTFASAALTFHVSKAEGLQFGMFVDAGVRVGGAQVVGSGFVSFGVDGLSLEFAAGIAGSADGALLVDAFNLDGVSVRLPLGLQLDLTPHLAPKQFALVAQSAVVAGASGHAVFGVDFEHTWRVGAQAAVTGANLHEILIELTGCAACMEGCLATVKDISLASASLSVSTDLVNPLSLAGNFSIPSGISAEVLDLSLWGGLIHVQEASFSLSLSNGLTAAFLADPVHWGPITITSADRETGPTLYLALTPDEHELYVSGRATVFNSAVELELHLTDDSKYAAFALDIGSGVSVDAMLVATGHPGHGDFSSYVTGSVLSEHVVDDATAFLYELQSKADQAFSEAQAELQEKQAEVDRKKAELDAVRADWDGELSGWRADIDALTAEINDMEQQCRRHEDACWVSWICPEAAWCWTEVNALKTARGASQATLASVELAADAAIAAAKVPFHAADAALHVTEAVLSKAEALTSAVHKLALAAGGVLKHVLSIQDIHFSATLTEAAGEAQFSGAIVVLGVSVTWDFTAELSYSACTAQISKELRVTLSKTWAASIPAICEGIEHTDACQ